MTVALLNLFYTSTVLHTILTNNIAKNQNYKLDTRTKSNNKFRSKSLFDFILT